MQLSYQLEMSIKVVLKARRRKGIPPSDELSPSKIFHPVFLHQRLDMEIAEDNKSNCDEQHAITQIL